MLAREFEDAMTESRAHPDPHQPAEPTWLAVMTTAGKVILGFGTAAYVLGIIVVNLHLGRYGYHSLGLLEASFVAAGWWAFAPIVLAMMLILSIKFMFWEAKLFARAEAAKLATPANPQPSAAPLSSWHQLFVCLEGVIAWLLFLVFLVYLLDIRWTWFWLAAMGLGCLSVGGILLVPTMIGRQSVKGDTLALISQLGVSCMVLPFYLILFARQVYPTIPPELGGWRRATGSTRCKGRESPSPFDVGRRTLRPGPVSLIATDVAAGDREGPTTAAGGITGRACGKRLGCGRGLSSRLMPKCAAQSLALLS